MPLQKISRLPRKEIPLTAHRNKPLFMLLMDASASKKVFNKSWKLIALVLFIFLSYQNRTFRIVPARSLWAPQTYRLIPTTSMSFP
jgi:hypothetical protein